MTEIHKIIIRTDTLSPEELRLSLRRKVNISLSDPVRKQILKSQETIDSILKTGETVYGVNTGFGQLANKRITDDQLGFLQRNLVLSHAAGTGSLLPDNTVRLILVLKIQSLSRGFSGVRPETVELLCEMINREVYPCIPAKGSVGASGDLAPLAHMAAPLIGEGEVRIDGEIFPAKEGFKKAGLAPINLGPKEGLALLNGTQVSTALALKGYFELRRVFDAAVLTGALSVDAVKGSDTPFDARIHEVRGQKGQIIVAELYRTILSKSEIRSSHLDCDRVQDPYSVRCQPQVMGAVLDMMDHAGTILWREANAVSDNPLVFPDEGEVLSGGNFHGEPVAISADALAIAASEVGALAERRLALLIDANLSGLPPFLVENSGLNSGFMIAQVTAAALASENKTLAHPASIDSLPTSANQEDHVSMATFAARRIEEIVDNVAGIIAIELLAAAQGVEFHRPLKTSPGLEELIAILRKGVPRYEEDRYFAPDIEKAKEIIRSRTIDALIEKHVPGWLTRSHTDK